MPNMANITVKKNDGTTDQVYTAMTPSGGDGVPAVWRAANIGSAPAHQPELRMTTREASKGAKRAVRGTYVFPVIATNSTTGITSVVDRIMISYDATVSKAAPNDAINEAVAQGNNLFASALFKQSAQQGFAPN